MIPITGTEKTHSPIHRKQHTAHCKRRRLACNNTDERRQGTADCTSRASSSADSTTPGGGVEPPRGQPAPGTSNTRIQSQTDLEMRRRGQTPMILFRGIWKPRGPARGHDPRPRRPDGRSTSPTGPGRQTEGLADHPGDLTSPERPAPAAPATPAAARACRGARQSRASSPRAALAGGESRRRRRPPPPLPPVL